MGLDVLCTYSAISYESLNQRAAGAEVEVNVHSVGAGALENGPFFVQFGR